MTTPRTRTDEFLERWMAATARSTPDFAAGSARGRRPSRVLVLAVAGMAFLLLVLASLAVGGLLDKQKADDPSAELADSAAAAIAAAPGVRFDLTISSHDGPGTGMTIHASGLIDFPGRRFSGTADGGGGGAPMLMFGGPASGAVIVADGLFVQTEGQPWVHVPGSDPHLEAFADRVRMSDAFRRIIASSPIDPGIRFKPCGGTSCRVITLTASPPAIYDGASSVLGPDIQPAPADLAPAPVELLIDPSSGFPVRLDAAVTAGSTTTEVSLELERLDPAPTISPPALISASPSAYMEDCAAFDLSAHRCQAIVDAMAEQLDVRPSDATSIELLGDPGCGDGVPCIRTGSFVVRVRFHMADGSAPEDSLICGGQGTILCTESPEVQVRADLLHEGYHDIPCSGETPTIDSCPTPVPTIDPASAADARPLLVQAIDIPLDHVGPYSVDLGSATLANGILSASSFTLADVHPTLWSTTDEGVQLVLESLDGGPPFSNIYEHGWQPGVERVMAKAVFEITTADPGAVMQIRDVVVR